MNENLRNALPHKDTISTCASYHHGCIDFIADCSSSNLTESDALSDYTLTGFVTWFHVITGLSLIVLRLIMLAWILDTTRDFITILLGWPLIFRGVVEDIKCWCHSVSLEAHAGGIAALIRGLGVLALLGVVSCGGFWFALNTILECRQCWQKVSWICISFWLYLLKPISGRMVRWGCCIYFSPSMQRKNSVTE